jgi:HSP20 family protein
VDIYESGRDLVLHVELPGVRRDDVDLRMEDGSLVIEGEALADPDLRAVDFHRVERAHGPFRRLFRLPPSVAADGIAAEMRQGILVVTLPRLTETGPTARIPIQGNVSVPEKSENE